MKRHSTSLGAYARTALDHRDLIYRLVSREFTQRFRGSMLGATWAVLTPLLTALIFAFVFGTVFKARWGDLGTGAKHGGFTLIFLTGLVTHGMFAEAIGRAPTLVVSNASYVKKVVFPLEILPVIAACTALINGAIGMGIVVLLNLAMNYTVHPTLLLLPLVLLPYMLLVIGLVLFLAATGVYVRDLSQVVGFVITVTMFMTPIFYPIEAVPSSFRPIIWLNPLTFVVQQARAVTVFGDLPDWGGLALYTLLACGLLWAGFWWFQRTRNGFADVI
jgi:lipopolysaccharide transport system permease protein